MAVGKAGHRELRGGRTRQKTDPSHKRSGKTQCPQSPNHATDAPSGEVLTLQRPQHVT